MSALNKWSHCLVLIGKVGPPFIKITIFKCLFLQEATHSHLAKIISMLFKISIGRSSSLCKSTGGWIWGPVCKRENTHSLIPPYHLFCSWFVHLLKCSLKSSRRSTQIMNTLLLFVRFPRISLLFIHLHIISKLLFPLHMQYVAQLIRHCCHSHRAPTLTHFLCFFVCGSLHFPLHFAFLKEPTGISQK